MKNMITNSLGVIIFLIFLVLKLAEIGAVADWSWWWVLAPIWVPIGIELAFGLAALIFFVVSRFFEKD